MHTENLPSAGSTLGSVELICIYLHAGLGSEDTGRPGSRCCGREQPLRPGARVWPAARLCGCSLISLASFIRNINRLSPTLCPSSPGGFPDSLQKRPSLTPEWGSSKDLNVLPVTLGFGGEGKLGGKSWTNHGVQSASSFPSPPSNSMSNSGH